MAGRNEIVQVKEEVEGLTASEVLKKSFTQVEEVFLCREEKLKMEIEGKNRENELLVGKLQRFKKEYGQLRGERDGLWKEIEDNKEEISVLKRKNNDLVNAKLSAEAELHIGRATIKEKQDELHRFKKEYAEFKELATRLTKEQDGLLKKVKENEDDKEEIIVLKRKNYDLINAKLSAEAELHIGRATIKEKQDELQRFKKEYAELKELTTRLTKERDGLQRFEKECGELKECVTRLTEERDGLQWFEKESGELKELVSRLTEERDELLKRVKENDDDHKEEITRKNYELECAKLNVETQIEIIEEINKRMSSLEKDWETEKGAPVNTTPVKLLLGTNSNPSGWKRTDMVTNIDSDDESSSSKRAKPLRVEQPVPFGSPIEPCSPVALNLENRLIREGEISAELEKLVSKLGDSSSSSSSSDDKVDFSDE